VKRRALLIVAGTTIVARALRAQQPIGKVFRIGVLLVTNRAQLASAGNLLPFERTLRELGYIEGQNLAIEWRGAQGQLERLPMLAAELVALKMDVIVAGADSAAIAAKSATKTIPIVFVAAADPVGLGLVDTLSRPGSNVTGFSSSHDTLVAKRVELLREIDPKMTRLAVLHQPGDWSSDRELDVLRRLAGTMKLKLSVHALQASTDIDAALQGIEKQGPEALLVTGSPLTFILRKRISGFAAEQRLLAIYPFAIYLEPDSLMSYGFSYPDNYRRAAEYVSRILKGAKPADLPVQNPLKFELVVNRKAATQLGVRIPASVTARADRVIE
jgi:putative ABC transport system substrate-binding protein